MDVIVAVLGVSIALAVLLAAVLGPRAKARQAESDHRRRYTLTDSDQRVPLNPGADAAGSAAGADAAADAGLRPIQGGVWTVPPDARPASPAATSAPIGRFVSTPDGDRVLTTPPFALKNSVLGARGSRYLNRLSARLPAWVIACPKVRLDSLLEPQNPAGRDAADWAAWRRRVRVRSIDILLCDRRGHRPLLAIVFSRRVLKGDPGVGVDARRPAGGEDRIIDEVLTTVGLPMVRVSGRFLDDWAVIQPYVDQSILPSVSEDQIDDSHAGDLHVPGGVVNGVTVPGGKLSTGGAVRLLRADGDKGWLLE